MGIRFLCPNGHRLNVKSFLAGKRAICPDCGARVVVPSDSEQPVQNLATAPSSGTAASRADTEWLESTAPSVVLALANELAHDDVAVDPLISTDSSLPESIIAATTVQPATVTVETKPEDIAAGLQRDRTRRNQMLVVFGLLMIVVVLAGTLIWVLKRSASSPPATDQVAPTTTSQSIQFVPVSNKSIDRFSNSLIRA
jgi:hypothetical protein